MSTEPTARTPPKHNGYLGRTEREIQQHLEFRHVMQRNILHDFVVTLTNPDDLRRAGAVEHIAERARRVLQEVNRCEHL